MSDWLGVVHCYLFEVCHLVTRTLSRKGGETTTTSVRIMRATAREEEMQDKQRKQEIKPKMEEAASLSMKETGVEVKVTMVEEVRLAMEEEEVATKEDPMELEGKEIETQEELMILEEVGVETEEEVLEMEVEEVETEEEPLGEEEDIKMELLGRPTTMLMVI